MCVISYRLPLLVIAVGALIAFTWFLQHPVRSAPLADYVARPDDSYSWSVYDRYSAGSAEIVELRLQSQTWRGQLFRHRLFLIRPPRVAMFGQGVVVLTGGRWREAYAQPPASPSLPDDAEIFFAIASMLESVVAVVDLVPFQPLFGRTEDELVAYTFDRFQATGDEDWPLLLPMVKTAVRAMDAVQSAASTELEIDLERFTLLGGSKRGWTAWLTAAVDPRVTAIAPVVFDALNMEAHFPYQTAVWGEPSEEILPYTSLNLHNVLSSDEGRVLREIVDPFAYRHVLTQPKLIVNATNDAYFPLDSANLYWQSLEGPSYALYLPNDGHDARDFRRLIYGLWALHRHVAGGEPMPILEWEYEQSDSGMRLCVRSDPSPADLQIWTALSDDRDFRDARWASSRLEPRDGIYVHEQPRPDTGFVAIFAEPRFTRDGSAFALSTTPAVVGVFGDSGSAWSAVSTGDVCDMR